jgi:hypothetical protein
MKILVYGKLYLAFRMRIAALINSKLYLIIAQLNFTISGQCIGFVRTGVPFHTCLETK